jgi:predicted glycogen debranching enzyme
MSSPSPEWIEADGLGGFASGTVSGERTRRYHALLLAATTPPTGRFVLVNGFEAWAETAGGRYALSTHRYAPDVVHPDGSRRIVDFARDPWPRWHYRLEDGTTIEQEILARHGTAATVIAWRAIGRTSMMRLSVRLFFSGRDYHALHHENGAFAFTPVTVDGHLAWRPYPGLPGTVVATNGSYAHEPTWYRSFLYAEESERGLDATEDLASPGVFAFDLSSGGDAVIVLATEDSFSSFAPSTTSIEAAVGQIREQERARREALPTPLERAADAYFVRRGTGKTIVAGYPWFTDWGRDTFIALRGLCLATGRLDDARAILLEWSGAVSDGMLPNRFPDHGEMPEFNSVDASLWYVIAAHELLLAAEAAERPLAPGDRRRLESAITEILDGHLRGTRFGIHADTDGLLAAGIPGVQLTWMDAKVGDWVVTPRIGKPVEIQALWLNALAIGARFGEGWSAIFERGQAAFAERFWNETLGVLYDVVDVDHRPGVVDASLRPNQILAVGGLPLGLVEGARARRIVDALESRLVTPLGLRSLDPADPAYQSRYRGAPLERDGAYHQGTVWPWLAGPFVEAWVRVRGSTPAAKQEARDRFVAPLFAHLDEAGLGHVSEIADAEPPHTPRGCPFQAWSMGELLRLDRIILR